MAGFCYAYRMTPAEYRALTLPEHRALSDHLRELAAAMRGK